MNGTIIYDSKRSQVGQSQGLKSTGDNIKPDMSPPMDKDTIGEIADTLADRYYRSQGVFDKKATLDRIPPKEDKITSSAVTTTTTRDEVVKLFNQKDTETLKGIDFIKAFLDGDLSYRALSDVAKTVDLSPRKTIDRLMHIPEASSSANAA